MRSLTRLIVTVVENETKGGENSVPSLSDAVDFPLLTIIAWSS